MRGEPVDPASDEIFAVLEAAGLGLIRFDQQLRVSSASLIAHRVLERRPGSLVGRTAMETFLDHRAEAVLRRAIEGVAGMIELAPSDRRSYVLRGLPAVGGGAWATVTDVTELERLRRIRSEFIDNVSHELRTPLANIRLLTEMLADELAEEDVPERIRERVATIDVESGHLVQMINELLDLSRMENATVQVRHDEIALRPLVEASLRHVETFAQRQGVTLIVRVPDDLPPVRGDEERLDQLLLNLLHNAIKFSPDGGEVIVAADEHPDTAVISVIDHGVGIPRQDQARVFERFYKVDRARQRGQGGTGLGLAIARHIADAHGGTIWLESIEGEGSTFSFSLPVA
jgi:two-component system phosphate regulon sensor histidine kinase PhoR